MKSSYTEDALVEQPAIALLAELGWQPLNGMDEYLGRDVPPGRLYLGRETSTEVVLLARLRPALHKLNPGLPAEAIELAIEELTRDRSRLGLTHANREVYRLLKDGVLVTFRDAEGMDCAERVRLMDWEHPRENDFLLVSQLWVSGEVYKRRADLVGFVNGIPLLFIELKAAHKHLADAYNHNLKDYRDQSIPHLFWYNGLVVLSNGSATRLGSFGAPFEHFNEWKKINSEGEEGVISLETALRGACTPARLLDLVENYSLFVEAEGGLKKLIAKYHQYLGVESAVESVRQLPPIAFDGGIEGGGKLGVFWHTQGSGKSYSMIFFAQKVLRKLPGNWTFVVVTDRKELDDQIYKNFADAGAVIEPQESVRAQSGSHLQTLLQEDHRYVFTLIHKFNTERGQVYPKLSDRADIIVMTDGAHRSQYDQLALNIMRNALPHAALIGFTGTPLMAGEERTRQVFGDYISIYNFKQSVDDNATVPLFYENRIPELQLTNQHLNQDMAQLLDDATLDEAQEGKLEREFAREYHLITRDDRLEKIAEDIVLHYMGLGYRGKAMVVAIDKATAVRLYDKVRKHWKMRLAELAADLENCDPLDRPDLESKLAFMQQTDMAVVVSQGQNEVEEMQKKGLDIRPHRERMVKEDLATRFKDAADPFRIVFVCAMWMTGFDVPSCSTIYLDKPMRNHTLMQTIARANRVFGEKIAGLIVDYIGIFRDLQRALAIYGSVAGSEGEGSAKPGEMPVEAKQALVAELESAIAGCRAFMLAAGVDLDAIQAAEGFQRVKLLDDAEDALLVNDETKNQYLGHANIVDRLFHAILPDKAANRFGPDRKAIVVIADKIRSETSPTDISGVMEAVEDLLDHSIAPKGYIIRPAIQALHNAAEPPAHWLDLSQLDFDALRKHFENSRKHIEAEKLRGQVNAKLNKLMRLNKTRADYAAQLQRLIDDYNAGRANVDEFFAQLISLAQNLNAEEKRGISKQLNEEELAVFDLLTRPSLKLNRKEKAQVKQVAKELLDTLKAERLVLDKLPETFTPELYEEKCEAVYQHVYDSYYGAGRSLYTRLA